MIEFTKVREVETPERGYKTDAGLDLFIPADFKEIDLPPNGSVIIPSGIKIKIPFGMMGVFLNKSSVASKKKLIVGAQVIDYGYSGEIYIDLHYIGRRTVRLSPGDKIAQLVFVPIITDNLREVDNLVFDISFGNKERGSNGFGSTNKKKVS